MNEQIPVDLLFILLFRGKSMGEDSRKRFEEAAFLYPQDRKMIARLEEAYPDLKDLDLPDDHFVIELEEKHGRGGRELYLFLRENTEYTEHILNKAEDQFGRESRDILYYLYAERHTQAETAEHFGLSRRKLQYRILKMFERIFADE